MNQVRLSLAKSLNLKNDDATIVKVTCPVLVLKDTRPCQSLTEYDAWVTTRSL